MPKGKKSKRQKQQTTQLKFVVNDGQFFPAMQCDQQNLKKKTVDKIIKIRAQIMKKQIQQLMAVNKLMKLLSINQQKQHVITTNQIMMQNNGLYKINSLNALREPQYISYTFDDNITKSNDQNLAINKQQLSNIYNDWFGFVLGEYSQKHENICYAQQVIPQISELTAVSLPLKKQQQGWKSHSYLNPNFIKEYEPTFVKTLKQIQNNCQGLSTEQLLQ